MPGVRFEDICPDASPEAISLLCQFLRYTNRISAQDVNCYLFILGIIKHLLL